MTGILRYFLSIPNQYYGTNLLNLSAIINLIQNMLPGYPVSVLLGVALATITLVEFYLFTLLLFGRRREEITEAPAQAPAPEDA